MVAINFKEELETLPFNELSLKLVYSKFNISQSYASELFKKEFGGNFRKCRKEKIIEEAERCLITTDLDIAQISKNLGYADIKGFKKFFKKEKGLTPTQFRKKYTTDKITPKRPLTNF